MRGTLADRFWAKVNTDGPTMRPELGPCWVWTASADRKGYGKMGLGRAVEGWERTHRIGFFLHHGRWPTPCCLHRCDNPPCVRWEHLFEGTVADNARDCAAKGRNIFQTHPERMARGERHHFAKLTEDDVRRIRLIAGSHSAVAREYGVTDVLIGLVRRRAIWKHIV